MTNHEKKRTKKRTNKPQFSDAAVSTAIDNFRHMVGARIKEASEKFEKKTRVKKDCSFTYAVFFRKNDPDGPPYCVSIHCSTHGSEWVALTRTLDHAVHCIENFPLVSGGLSFGQDAFPVPESCIIRHIPHR